MQTAKLNGLRSDVESISVSLMFTGLQRKIKSLEERLDVEHEQKLRDIEARNREQQESLVAEVKALTA